MKRSETSCRLTPALRKLLQRCVELGAADTKTLAVRLGLSPKTINTMFQRITSALEVSSRTSALIVALRKGWIVLPKSDDVTADSQKMNDFSVLTCSNYAIDNSKLSATSLGRPKRKGEMGKMEQPIASQQTTVSFTPFVMLWAEEVPSERVYGSRSEFLEAPVGTEVHPADTDFEHDEGTNMLETSFTYTF